MMERPPRALLLGAAGLLLLLLPLSSSSSSDACGPCVPASCPALPRLGCPLGETRDACGCCPVCARGEGEPCGGGAAGRGHCAPGMECVKSRKRRKGKAGAAAGGPATLAVCVCKSRYPVCGSNGITYPSGCQLRAASLRAESRGEKAITQVSKGTCEQGSLIWDTQPAQRSHNPQVENRCFRDKHSREQGKDENIDQEMDLLELSKGFERDHTAMKLQECVRVAQGLQDSKLVHSPWEFSELRAPKGNFNGAFGS